MDLGKIAGFVAGGLPGAALFGNSGPGSNDPDVSKYMGPQFGNLSNFGPNPYASPLQGFISNFKGIQAPTVTAPKMSDMALPQYDAMRSRLNSAYNDQQSKAQDSIDRQFAAMGGGPGNGAQAKQTENLAGEIAKQKGSDLEGINAQEAETRTALTQQEKQNEFQAGLANAGNQMQAQEFNTQMPAQLYGELANLNTGWDAAQAEANNNEFNKALSQWQATHSGGLFGGGGFLGLGA